MILILVVAIIIIYIAVKCNKKKFSKNAKEKINNIIQENNIKSTKAVDISRGRGISRFIVDDENEKVWYIQVDKENGKYIKSLEFKDVYKVELIKDSKTKLTEDHFSIFNNYNKKEYVKNLGLRISFNDMQFPFLDILFLKSISGQTLTGLGHVVNSTNTWIQTMQIVIERGKKQ